MSRFSERIGAVEKPLALQVDSMSDALRNSLWNYIHELYESSVTDYWIRVAKVIAKYFRKVPVDELPYNNYDCRNWIKKYFYGLPWYAIYDLVDFIPTFHKYVGHHKSNEAVEKNFNYILERELSAYRFVSGILSPISDKTETDAISDAIQSSEAAGLTGASEHLRTSLKLLGKKPEPDYRNSIKEAISAVESVTIMITGTKSTGIGSALDKLSASTDIHGSLKAGFKNLYGYASDEDGIRHGMQEDPNVGFAEAKYMIVSCSGFVHYLIQKADDAGLLKR